MICIARSIVFIGSCARLAQVRPYRSSATRWNSYKHGLTRSSRHARPRLSLCRRFRGRTKPSRGGAAPLPPQSSTVAEQSPTPASSKRVTWPIVGCCVRRAAPKCSRVGRAAGTRMPLTDARRFRVAQKNSARRSFSDGLRASSAEHPLPGSSDIEYRQQCQGIRR